MSETTSAGEVFIPALGVAMEDALLVQWHKQPGDAVEADEPVAEIETDKATMELVAPCAGFLGPHLFPGGATVPVGAVVARVVEVADAVGAIDAPATEAPEAAADSLPTAIAASTAGAATADVSGTPNGDEPEEGRRLSPRARRLARERGDASRPEQAVQRDFREIIAARVTESWRTIPHFTVTRSVDADALLAGLERARGAVDERVTLTDLLVRALATAVADVEQLDPVDVGLAVATERGVAIPVLRNVLTHDLASLARARAEAVSRAREGQLNEDDVRAPAPATTLSNLGALGIDHFTGVIALGQTTLLTVGRVVRQPVVDDDGNVVVRARFNATLNVDHRALDGADAARLLASFAEAVNASDPEAVAT